MRAKFGLIFLSPQVLSSLVPSLIGYVSDSDLSDTALGVLVNVAQASPTSIVPFLSTLRKVGQKNPWLLGHIAKIHGAVGLNSEVGIYITLVLCLHHTCFMLQIQLVDT